MDGVVLILKSESEMVRKGRLVRRPRSMLAATAILALGMALSTPVRADFELTTPDGRRIQLIDNGTWRYVEETDKDQAEGKAKQEGEAVLTLVSRNDHGTNCRFGLQLVNDLPYEIRSLVPYYSAYRAN